MDEDNPYSSPRSTSDDQISQSDRIDCPMCGEVAEKGYLRSFGSIDWIAGSVSSFKLTKGVERLTSGAFVLEGKLAAIRCRQCSRIVIET